MNINKLYLPLRFYLICLAIAAPFLISSTFALEPAYWWHDDKDTKFSKSDWMKDLPDELPLDRISMVGTHDSCGYSGGDAFRSQRLSLTKQLNIGIRAMDIWARHSKNSLYINHGIWYQNLTFEAVIKEVITFLYYHNKETVIMRVSPDGTLPDNNSNSYDDAFKAVYNKYSSYFWKGPFNTIPKLKDIRGKIVILQKFTGPLYGIPWASNLKIQEHYHMRTNWDLYDRWERVKKHINDSYDSGGGKGIYINYLTGSGGSFPYFVASGKSSPQTGAPWLMTGRTTPGWKNSYLDWPRINCFIGICSIPFVGVNYSTSSYVKNKHYGKKSAGYVGILLAAFPGQELIENVIAVNYPINPQFSCVPGFTSCNGVCVDLKTSKSNCGQCGKSCWFGQNSSATCENSVCGIVCIPGFDDCDKIPTNGCEKSLTTINDCLSCGNKCPIPANGAAICTSSGCSIGECGKSYAKCGSDNTCSTNIDTSVDNCGGCGKKCSSPTNGSATCSAGSCGFSCAQGFTKCGENCISQNTDINNCGGCGIQCPKPANGVAICESGVCGVSSCPLGLANCDKDLANGCETSILSDILSCGACNSACKIDNATGVCLNGSCGVSRCDTGYAQCGNQNGCLTNINTDFNNCGGCGQVCNLNNAQSSCSGGSCKVDSCSSGFKDCNGTTGDGCEINSLSDVNNCGVCGNSCAKPANGDASCVAGVCSIKTCESGFADCDGNPANGCEVNISSDENNCNSCGKICPALANGISKCENGSCGLKECIAGLGFMDCDKLPTNGCETPINTTSDCGGCGPQFTCTAPSNAEPLCLIGGTCATGGVCKEGFKDCNNQSSDGCEVDLIHDVANCGACGTTCQPQPNGSPPICTNGICEAGVCPTGLAHCPGNQGCQTQIDNIENCGSCGNKCLAPINKTALCTSGACEVSPFCNEGYGDCDGDPVNGCETDLRSTTENCGTCGKTCNLSNSAGICMNSQCVPGYGTCQAGYAHCTGPDSEGCETKLDTVANCGACEKTCSSQGGIPSCGQDGKCSITCNDGFADCNNNPSDGCEVDLKTSENNCNACGVACNSTNNNPTCNGGTCITGNCASGFGKCGDDIGCSTPINTNENCGACGQTCDLKDKHVAVSQCSTTGECKIVTCERNFVDCDGNSANGCEVDITKVENCGTCGNQCTLLANTTAPFCKNNQGNYSCGIGACLPGYAHYSSNENDGCETNTNTDVNHCGSGGTSCPSIDHGTPACHSGQCGIGSCDANYVDKNNSPSDGCEINTKNDILNCGAIGNICSAVNGTPNCEDGICGIQCSPGYGDCNEQPGCETNIQTTPDHCGKCSVACSTANNSPSCIAGNCVAGTCSPGFGQCTGDAGCNTKLNTNGNCGSCGHTCSLNNAGSTCSEGGTCIVTSCLPGWSDCNGLATDGCETDITTIANCGICEKSCNTANNTPTCTTGDCIIGTCLPGFGKCGSDIGCNTPLSTDNNCGECGKKCDLANVEVSKCSSGACTIVECKDGYMDCNDNPLDGCERDIKTIANCGACNNACNLPLNAISTICKKEEPFKYSCEIGSCKEGWGNFDGDETNGCETNTNTSVDHCGPSGSPCPLIANGIPACTGGVCGIGSCNENYVDLINGASDGCETNIKSDPNNCGSVGNVCIFDHASALCENGSCVLGTCESGYGLCGGASCLPLSTVDNCGSCTNSCSFPNASAKCENGDCKLGICNPGFALCGGDTCIDLARDPNNCAQCGTVCPTPSNGSPLCSAGSCNIACDPNYVSCSGSCIPESSLTTDLLNCGSCGTHCTQAPQNGSPSCQNGTCGFTCEQGYTLCDGACVSQKDDINNCGGCGNVCGFANGSSRCDNGQCVLDKCNLGFGNCDSDQSTGCEKVVDTIAQCGSCTNTCPVEGNRTPACLVNPVTGGTCGTASCLDGFSDCDGISENGCETNLKTTAIHCGTCATACTSATGQPICENGLCTTGTCNPGLADCNETRGDGCEINTLTDKNNCGGCGNVCSFANGNARCDNGQCVLDSCAQGYGNCNDISSDGCETQVNSLANCSTCGNECIAPPNQAPICLQGLTCAGAACATGFGDCDGNASNGCEANLNTSPISCGSCGNICSAPLNAHATCSTGTCDFICNDGYTRCGDQCISTTSLASDTNNCGSCGKVCASAPANAVPACITSGCSFACLPGYTKCGNSCIADSTFLTDVNNCNGCGNVCPIPANGTASCQNGACNVGSCNLGFSNCDGVVANGCETNILSTDKLNCGSCGNICTTQPNGSPAACTSGSCAAGTCADPFLRCGNDTGCNTNINTSTTNCGGCSNICSSLFGTASCLGGSCGITCDANHADCTSSPGCETSINNTSNCGGCGIECNLANANENCTLQSQGYVCGISACNSGFGNCDSNSANGCETLLSTNSHCGTCANTCATDRICQLQGGSYSCVLNSCPPPTATCPGGTTCGTNINTSATNCGACGNNCTTLSNSSGNTCSSGACVIGACSSGFANCDGTASDGCEADLSSILSCGACGNNCNNLQNTIGNSCIAQSCQIGSCEAGYGNCDNVTTNGCESALDSSLNCGGCGLACNISGQNCNKTTLKCEGGVFSYYAYVLLSDNTIAQYAVNGSGELSISTTNPTVSSGPLTTFLNFSPDGTRIFVTASNNKVALFTEDKTAKTLYEESRIAYPDPMNFVLSPDGNFAWIISNQSSEIGTARIGTAGLTVIGTPYSTGGGKPVGGAITPDGKYLFVVNQVAQNIVQFLVNINTGSLTPNGTISAIPSSGSTNSNPGPTMIRTSPDGRFVYVTNAKYNQVLQYSIGCDSLGACGKLTLIGSVPTGSNPTDLFVSPTGKFAYVVNKGSNTVSQYSINSTTGALSPMGSVATGTGPSIISVSYNGKYAYVSNEGSKNISQYSIGSNGQLTPLPNPTAPTPNNTVPSAVLVH